MSERLSCGCSRRDFMRRGLLGIGVAAGLPTVLGRTSAALALEELQAGTAGGPTDLSRRILVVVELSGGNDGLNTVVPFRNDEYYRVRPNLGIRPRQVLQLEDEAGLHPSMVGMERLYKEGQLAVVEGCGYPNPSLSHFSSMGFWHTGVPNGGEDLGWLGRLADDHGPDGAPNYIVNVARSQALAVRAARHSPLVFDDPGRLRRLGTARQKQALDRLSVDEPSGNDALDFVRGTASNAASSAALVRDAWSGYRTPVDYGIGGLGVDLRKVAALIQADLPTRIYYVSFRGNSFDTHVHQADTHARLLMYMSDAVAGFLRDVERIGRADDVSVLMFTEFGRRVEENGSLGTDHGTAGPMFVAGKGMTGGFFGETPSLTDLDDGNLKMTTDFRRVYASAIEGWMGMEDASPVLKGAFEPLPIFAPT